MSQMTYVQFLEEIGRLEEMTDAYYDAVGQWEEDTEWYDDEMEAQWEDLDDPYTRWKEGRGGGWIGGYWM